MPGNEATYRVYTVCTYSMSLELCLSLMFCWSSISTVDSRVEIESYSVAYFDCIAVFEALHC